MVVRFARTKLTAYAPKRANEFAAGWDLYSAESGIVEPFGNKLLSTGIAIELPVTHHASIRPRSGLAKHGIFTVYGTIDCDYRGEMMVNLINPTPFGYEVKFGDRIAQLVVEPYTPAVEFIEVQAWELSETVRGASGFGSTGK